MKKLLLGLAVAALLIACSLESCAQCRNGRCSRRIAIQNPLVLQPLFVQQPLVVQQFVRPQAIVVQQPSILLQPAILTQANVLSFRHGFFGRPRLRVRKVISLTPVINQ